MDDSDCSTSQFSKSNQHRIEYRENLTFHRYYSNNNRR